MQIKAIAMVNMVLIAPTCVGALPYLVGVATGAGTAKAVSCATVRVGMPFVCPV